MFHFDSDADIPLVATKTGHLPVSRYEIEQILIRLMKRVKCALKSI